MRIHICIIENDYIIQYMYLYNQPFSHCQSPTRQEAGPRSHNLGVTLDLPKSLRVCVGKEPFVMDVYSTRGSVGPQKLTRLKRTRNSQKLISSNPRMLHTVCRLASWDSNFSNAKRGALHVYSGNSRRLEREIVAQLKLQLVAQA